MLTILTTTEHQKQVASAISTLDRLDELVDISLEAATVPKENKVLVVNSIIKVPLDWNDTEPPYVFPNTDFSEDNFLAFVFLKLGNHQKAFEYLSEGSPLYTHFLITTHLQFGYEISEKMMAFLNQNSNHNLAITLHYGNVLDRIDFDKLKNLYNKVIENSENDEIKLFTAKHFINLLMDGNLIKEAKSEVQNSISLAISDEAINAMNVHLASILKSELKIPYSEKKLEETLSIQQKCIAFYETQHQKVKAGLLLTDAAEVANYKEDFILSKELINKAISYFKQEDIPEFLGEAGLKKAILLYTWSKSGQPQYYKAAINAFQDTLKVFKRDTFAQKFAEVHHNLALIYSEMPASPEERGIWAAFSASSFKNAVEIYEKDKFPYEFAMVSHNYATALMNFPPAKIHDNLAKANGFFEEALEIRTASKYPMERALTLLNQLELYWLTHNEDTEAEEKKYQKMVSKAQEIKSLVSQESLILQAENHLKRLKKLKAIINK